MTTKPTFLPPSSVWTNPSMILLVGQSNGNGYTAQPALSTSQPFSNLKFAGGVRPAGGSLASAVALTEDDSRVAAFGWAAGAVETVASGMADLLSSLAGVRVLVACDGLIATSFGTVPLPTEWANVTTQLAAFAALYPGCNVVAAVAIQGETDDDQSIFYPAFQARQVQQQIDIQRAAQTATGQTVGVPLFLSQMSNWCDFSSGAPNGRTAPHTTPVVPQQQTACALQNPSGIIVAGPTYHLPCSPPHRTNHGHQWEGEHLACAIYRRLYTVGQWKGLRPSSAVRVGAVVTITFDVPVAPLAWDVTSGITDPGHYGFEWYDDTASATISSVALVGTTQVAVTLSGTPTGANKAIRYGWTSAGPSGPTTGPRGLLVDSDATASLHGYDLRNRCVHFTQPA